MGSNQEGTPDFSAFLLGWTMGPSLRSGIQEEEQEVIVWVLNTLNRRGLWNIHVERQVLIHLYYLLLSCWDCLSSTSNFSQMGSTVQSKKPSLHSAFNKPMLPMTKKALPFSFYLIRAMPTPKK